LLGELGADSQHTALPTPIETQPPTTPPPTTPPPTTPPPTTPPPTTPPPTPTPTPTPTSETIWRTDYETGDLSAFDSTPWNNVPTAPVVSTSARSGNYAGAYAIPAGGNRCENVPKVRHFTEGDDLWFAFSTKLQNVPLSSSEWQDVAQWKNDGIGSPPLEVSVDNGRFNIGGGYGWPGNTDNIQPKLAKKSLGTATNGTWDDWVFHIKFSSNTAVGYVEVWRNGTKVLDPWYPPGGTLYPSLASYLKVGYYRSKAISQDSTVLHDDWRVGATRQSVGA
jgi:hypothetical protein